MNRSFITLCTLAVALTAPAFAQTTAPTSVSPAPAPAPPPPVASNAKIALIAFQEAVFSTNEGEAKMQEVQRKYEPTKAKIETLGNEIDTLKKKLDTTSTTMTEDDKAALVRTLDSKTKELQLEEDTAQQSYNADLGKSFNDLASKLYPVAQQYASDNGFTLLLNETQQQNELPMVMWAAEGQDITKAVIDTYNTKSGVAAPPPSAPTPHHTAPATHTAPKPATSTAPKP